MTERHYGRPPTPAAAQVQRIQEALPSEKFEPLPAPVGAPPFRMQLSTLITDPTDKLVLHTVGDTGGVKNPTPQQNVVKQMALRPAPHLLYHLGDLVYFNGDHSEWYPQFYEPYDALNWPIVAIPGNHDGDNSDDPAVPSLDAFVKNMCAQAPVMTQDAKDAHRDAMTQPNVYWTLEAALATVVGLYTNVPSGGVVKPDQAAWLAGELAAAPTDRALIVAMHHPPYSADAEHGGSKSMGAILDAACTQAGRWPELVLTGHVHDYQRFTRPAAAGRPEIAYIVAGAGGYHNLHPMAPGITSYPWTPPGSDVVLEAANAEEFGFLELTVTPGHIDGAYFGVSTELSLDTFTIPT